MATETIRVAYRLTGRDPGPLCGMRRRRIEQHVHGSRHNDRHRRIGRHRRRDRKRWNGRRHRWSGWHVRNCRLGRQRRRLHAHAGSRRDVRHNDVHDEPHRHQHLRHGQQSLRRLLERRGLRGRDPEQGLRYPPQHDVDASGLQLYPVPRQLALSHGLHVQRHEHQCTTMCGTANCTTNPTGNNICDLPNNRCVGCLADTDCADEMTDKICDLRLTGMTMLPAGNCVQCVMDAQCPSGQVCGTTGNTANTCVTQCGTTMCTANPPATTSATRPTVGASTA